jgi:hypothetical protein
MLVDKATEIECLRWMQAELRLIDEAYRYWSENERRADRKV